jgi:hypothetical protein
MIQVNDNWNKIIKTNCCWNWELHNLQPIKEQLLRLSCKWTEDYASDILIFFEEFNKYFLEEDIIEIDFYFRSFGINWIRKNAKDEIKKVGGELDKYIGIAKLAFNGKDMGLYWQSGNI